MDNKYIVEDNREHLSIEMYTMLLNEKYTLMHHIRRVMNDATSEAKMLIEDMNVTHRSDDEDMYDNTVVLSMQIISERFHKVLTDFDVLNATLGSYDIILALENELKTMIRQGYNNIGYGFAILNSARTFCYGRQY